MLLCCHCPSFYWDMCCYYRNLRSCLGCQHLAAAVVLAASVRSPTTLPKPWLWVQCRGFCPECWFSCLHLYKRWGSGCLHEKPCCCGGKSLCPQCCLGCHHPSLYQCTVCHCRQPGHCTQSWGSIPSGGALSAVLLGLLAPWVFLGHITMRSYHYRLSPCSYCSGTSSCIHAVCAGHSGSGSHTHSACPHRVGPSVCPFVTGSPITGERTKNARAEVQALGS